MADNVQTEQVTTPDLTWRTDEIGGIHYSAGKINLGADNTDDGFVSTSNPLPVDLRTDNVGGIEIVQDTAADLNVTAIVSQINGNIDSNNSTSTPLAGDAVYTGTSTEITNYANISVSIIADQDSATDGLEIQQSQDNTNWDFVDYYTIPADSGKVFTIQPVARYLRVVYTNGSSAQSSFRLQTILKSVRIKPSSHRIADSIIDDDDAELVKAVLSGENPSGSFINFGATAGGNFKVSIEEVNGTSNLASETGGNLDTIAGDTTSIDGKITACNTGAVTVAASALPSGAATAANQTSANTKLDSIISGQLPDGHNVTIDNGAGGSAVNIQDGGNSITIDNAALTELGNAINSNRVDINIANSGVTVPISASALPLPSGAATAANQSTGNSSLSSIDGKITTCNTGSIAGTVTANAGTNLNTSALALESGGNLATVAGAVSGSEMQVDVVASLPAGTNNIGDVDVVTQPARDNATDTITASLDTAAIMNDTTALTPKFAVIDAASSGDNTLVAAVAAKKIRVLSLFLVAAGDVLARFESGAAGTALTGQMDLTANSGFTLPFNPVGWFETGSNTLLNLELDGAVSCDGCLVYVEV